METRTMYRAVYIDYAGDPLPSRSWNGRFHSQPGTTTYLALTPETAWREVKARWQAEASAYRMVEVQVTLSRVVDLTDSSVRAARAIRLGQLTGDDHEPCRALAEQLRTEGIEGIWTFSAADSPEGRQLVVFLDQLQPVSVVRIVSVREVEGGATNSWKK